jgi:hypothetical protein
VRLDRREFLKSSLLLSGAVTAPRLFVPLPSSIPTPSPTPAGYQLVPAGCDDFTSLDLTKWDLWESYLNPDGTTKAPGGTEFAWWGPSHVHANGILQIVSRWGAIGTSGKMGWVSGGLGSKYAQTFGGYEWCSRGTRQEFLSNIVQLFPLTGTWPPELDLCENDGSQKQTSATVHYVDPTGKAVQGKPHHRIMRGIDTLDWNVWGAWWSPGSLTLTHNGHVWQQFSRDIATAPLNLCIQSEFYSPVQPVQSSAVNTFDVAWVRTYAPA